MTNIIKVFTDGSCVKYNKTSIAGYGIYFPNKELHDISRPFNHTPITNQRAELYAIFVALVLIKKHIKSYNEIIIYTDSEYSIKCSTIWMYKWVKNKWKTANGDDVKNQDILQRLYSIIMKQKDKIKFVHVKSHTGKKDVLSVGNAIVDKLATSGAQKSKIVLDI